MFVLDQITINLNYPGQRQRIYASVGDSGTRAVEVKLITNDGDWHIPDGVSCVIRFVKADGHQGVYYSLPDGSNAWTVSGNVLTCVLAEQVLTCPGIVEVSAVLVQGTERLGVFGFDIHVAHDAVAELEESSDYYSIEDLEEINAAFANLTSDLGRKAPAGYGLGGTNGAVVTDANNATNNGWYTVYNGGTNLPGTSFGGAILVKAFFTNNIIQTLYYSGHNGGECRRICTDGIWGQWEFSTPPMYAGIEYCTMERFNGKSVYTKLIDCGTVTNGKAVSHGAGGGLIRMAPVCSGILSTSINNQTDDWAWVVSADQTAVRMTCGSGIAGNASWKVQIWYTKD